MMTMNVKFDTAAGLVPAVVQDAETGQVLMVGYMNREALERTETNKRVTFWSRSKQKLWEKGETSGNTLQMMSIVPDCDGDALLVKAIPHGPTCHTGSVSCFGDEEVNASAVLGRLEKTIAGRKEQMPAGSYTAELFQSGTSRIAQKVGEEAVEVVIAAMEENGVGLLEESSDLLYHLLVLLKQKGKGLNDVLEVLRRRMKI
jgi:phosphoribosyl-ATP pyrophosphohydrolase/phosphoribosyl-AMP cyclohydrolase